MDAVEREIITYSMGKPDRLPRREWGFFPETESNWKQQGWGGSKEQFMYDEYPYCEELVDLVGIDIPVVPSFVEEIIKSDDTYIYTRTVSGAIEKFPKNKRRWGEIMPLYVKNPVEKPEDWYDFIKPRLNPETPERWNKFYRNKEKTMKQLEQGEKLYEATCIGGYMYLRAMLGPEKVCLAFYDTPEMIHDMMRTWLHLVKTCLSRVQKKVLFFKLLIGEDISYKNGLLISPEMCEEFLFPYYRTLIESLQNGQKEFMHAEVDTDGNVSDVIPLYMKVGFNVLRPFEVAAGNDVVEIAKKYPGLIMSGGIDKRILAESKEAIKAEVERIIPFMLKRGGYIPTCDHTVPSNVPYENYLYYRQIITSLDHY
ncbi:MAG: uroporphyrinogen decarboxylase family protein [Saccharofermentanales bacterium]